MLFWIGGITPVKAYLINKLYLQALYLNVMWEITDFITVTVKYAAYFKNILIQIL